ncbi:hypothetical protein PCK2_000954 [Pneumocystis canis]|nr:hypothetical protein PCK2_000954 [Pneumocystis canis]
MCCSVVCYQKHKKISLSSKDEAILGCCVRKNEEVKQIQSEDTSIITFDNPLDQSILQKIETDKILQEMINQSKPLKKLLLEIYEKIQINNDTSFSVPNFLLDKISTFRSYESNDLFSTFTQRILDLSRKIESSD